MSLIIKLCGTSGSGKSTAMRRIMEGVGAMSPVFLPGRKRPHRYDSAGVVVVFGHYETDCGGCDSLGSAPAIYQALNEHPCPVAITEGLLWSEDTKWTLRLKEEGHEVRCVFLLTPAEECLRRIGLRRAGAGNDKPVNPDNTVNRIPVIERARRKLLAAGIICRRASSSQAPGIVLNWLKLHDFPT